MSLFAPRQVEIEAFRWTGGPDQTEDPVWIVQAIAAGRVIFDNSVDPPAAVIKTRAGDLRATPGDWIVREANGEISPLKPDVFEATYEPAADTTLKRLQDQFEVLARAHKAKGKELDDTTARLKSAGDDVNDLKERLANAEAENQRMRGYIARVQEDDVVREDLVQVGDIDGEMRLVPKRKSTPFHPPNAYAAVESAAVGKSFGDSIFRERKRPRHWVNY